MAAISYEGLISERNLKLAWRRITTGRNLQYKKFFRPLYFAYEVAHEEHISRLHQRLVGRWQATPPTRIYLPKSSGLQRPITLLSLDDQIVLQAVANVFASRLRPRRSRLEASAVFSNLLETSGDSKFFIQDWHRTYVLFQDKCREHFSGGFRWIAQFDLAAFYDTVSHELLLRMLTPRNIHTRLCQEIREWFRCWSRSDGGNPFQHGIPQGPIASDFLAEALLLPLDEALNKEGIRYVRYVDDIRIFAKSKADAQGAAVRLEVLCRNMGLIPQGKKFTILEAKSLEQVLGQLPSLAPPDAPESEKQGTLTAAKAEQLWGCPSSC